jgi:hypothetical protein
MDTAALADRNTPITSENDRKLNDSGEGRENIYKRGEQNGYRKAMCIRC